ncbi:unnamed protein product [Protopolystoma xenopodis]|uniref:Dynein heavy chain hydrolytic ATP-binding dynein motor region domain-containing protein n=1 Tax=Protopolystoma xenopodis TaxID=117903 RepID=A0A448XGQ8_9PLAT|nr:unnamed protein product [Protopolystoma xenopodis]
MVAGVLRRAEPDLREDQLLMRALRQINLPKLVVDDIPLFSGLITDLFPGVEQELTQLDSRLVSAISTSMLSHGYTIVQDQILKAVQLRDTLKTRHSVMVIGPTCGGKTVVITMFTKAQKK